MISFGNWPEYIDYDPDDHRLHPSLAEFTRRTGIAVDYSEPVTTNEHFFARVAVPQALGHSGGYDLVVVSDWLVGQFIGMGWARALRPEGIPHAENLLPALRVPPLDAVYGYSLPWQAGLTGIACNLAATGRAVTSVTDLLTAPDLRGRVSLTADMRDVMGLILLDQGHDPASFTNAEFDLALEVLAESVRAGQIRTVTNRYRAGLARGDIAACIGWSGDVLSVARSHPQVRFAIPDAGALLWTDNLMIPAHAQHPAEAERLIDYYYQPEVAARLAVSLMFICPVEGAAEAVPSTGLRLSGDQQRHMFPPPEVLAASRCFRMLTPVQNSVYTDRYISTVGL